MAWDEQRRMRETRAEDTAQITAVTGPPAGDGPPAAPVPRQESAFEQWSRRFGWMVAVGLSVIALLLAGILLANSRGGGHAGFRSGGERFGAPGFGAGGYGYRGYDGGAPTAPGGSGSQTHTAPGGSGQFPAPRGMPSQ